MKAKVNDLAAQLSRIQDSSRETDADWRLTELEERVARAQNAEEVAFRTLMDRIARAEQLLSTQRLARENFEEKRQKDIRAADTAFRADITAESKEFADTECEATRRFDKNVEKLRKDFANELTLREEQLREGVSNAADRLAQLQEDFLCERAAREESFDALIRRIGSQILRVNNMLTQERRTREAVHAELLGAVLETQSRLQSEIAGENEARRRNQDALLRVLEETCMRIEHNIR